MACHLGSSGCHTGDGKCAAVFLRLVVRQAVCAKVPASPVNINQLMIVTSKSTALPVLPTELLNLSSRVRSGKKLP